MQRMTIRLAVLLLLLGTSLAWSQKHPNPEDSGEAHSEAETKIRARYPGAYKAPHTYILEPEDQDHHAPHAGAEEYEESEDGKAHAEKDEAQGKEESDKNLKEDSYNDFSEKGGHQGFKAGGASFDKHLKDHKLDNKEVENVKAHDAGEKFGGKALKEHKLGKQKEKSKGHKLNGFKNVYHKEEYGDHKTFHDEFLDSDHLHNYDDQHEHQEMQGGKFSKGFKHEGKNKKFDKGDEKREWGKEEFDGHKEGKHDKGGQSSKHRHGSKKHQGHYDANSQRNKNSVHKVRKGTPPPHVPHHSHHGPHQAQIQPYVSHHHPHHQQVDVPSHHYKPHSQQQSHQAQYDDDDQHDNYKNHNHGGQHSVHGGHNHGGQHSVHGGHNHGGHHDHDQHNEYSSDVDDDGDDSEYKERVAQHHHMSPVKERLVEDKSEEKIIQKQEPVVHKQSVSPNYGIQQYRQPVYHEQPRFKQPEFIRQEKLSHPFEDKFQNHRVRYGYQQPLNHFHHQHHQQPFSRFPEFSHHHHGHGHHHHNHGGHRHQFRHTPTIYEQASKPDFHAGKSAHIITKPEQNDGYQRFSQKII